MADPPISPEPLQVRAKWSAPAFEPGTWKIFEPGKEVTCKILRSVKDHPVDPVFNEFWQGRETLGSYRKPTSEHIDNLQESKTGGIH